MDMRSYKHLRAWQPGHARRVAVAAAAAAATLAVAALGTAPGLAAPSGEVDGGSQPASDGFRQPTLDNGLLTIVGTVASDTVALRLRVGEPGVLEVDVGDDGTA